MLSPLALLCSREREVRSYGEMDQRRLPGPRSLRGAGQRHSHSHTPTAGARGQSRYPIDPPAGLNRGRQGGSPFRRRILAAWTGPIPEVGSWVVGWLLLRQETLSPLKRRCETQPSSSRVEALPGQQALPSYPPAPALCFAPQARAGSPVGYVCPAAHSLGPVQFPAPSIAESRSSGSQGCLTICVVVLEANAKCARATRGRVSHCGCDSDGAAEIASPPGVPGLPPCKRDLRALERWSESPGTGGRGAIGPHWETGDWPYWVTGC